MSLFVYIVLCLIWGTTWLAIKLGLAGAPPLLGAGIRFVIAVSILIVIARLKKAKFPRRLPDWLRLAHPGLYMYAISYSCVYFGEQWIDSALAAVLFGSFPLFVALLSSLFLASEKVRGLAWVGLGFGFVGVFLISYESFQTSADLFLGSMLMLVGSLSSAWGLILHKRTCATQNMYAAITTQMGVGAVLLLPAGLIFENPSDLVLSHQAVGSILYLAVFGSVLAFWGYYWLLTHMRAVTVSMITFVTPLVAIGVGVFLFHESLSGMHLLGAALILSGIALVARR